MENEPTVFLYALADERRVLIPGASCDSAKQGFRNALLLAARGVKRIQIIDEENPPAYGIVTAGRRTPSPAEWRWN